MYGVSRTQTRRARRTGRRRHEQFRRIRWQTRPCRSSRCATLCVQRDISQFGIGLFTSQERLDSLMLDDNLRQDHTSKQCYLPLMFFAKGNESLPSGKSAASFKLSVISHGPIDARTTAAICTERLGELEGNARPAPAVLNCFVAALPAARPAPANGDDAVDGDEGGLLIAQPAALPLVEPCLVAGADSIVPTADEEEIDGGQDNVDFPWTLCGQPLRGESHGSRLEFGFRVDCKIHAKCRKYGSIKVGLQQFGHFACLYYLGA